jgi:chromate transporter
LRNSQVIAGLLDGANVVSLVLMAGVTFKLGCSSVVEPIPALLTLAALVLLFWTTINPGWLVLGDGVVGLVFRAVLG